MTDSLTRALQAAPELYESPGSAAAVSMANLNTMGMSTAQTAQAFAHASNMAKLAKAQDHVRQKTSHGFLNTALHGIYNVGHAVNKATGGVVGHAFGEVSHLANAGLQEVQHQYRYLHDVEARHGVLALMAAGSADVLGGVAGAFAGGYPGAVEGAELLGGITARNLFSDSWRRTEKGARYRPDYNRETGQYTGKKGTVSFGRDVTSAMGFGRSGALSGMIDATFDLGLDPVAVAGSQLAAARAGQYVVRGAEGMIAAHATSAAGEVGSEAAATAERVVQARASDFLTRVAPKAGFQRVAADIAKLDSPLDIARNYKSLTPYANEFAAAKTPEAVTEVFTNAFLENQMRGPKALLGSQGAVPHISLERASLRKVTGALDQVPGVQALKDSKVYHAFTTYTGDNIDYEKMQRVGTHQMPLGDNRNIVAVENWFRKAIPHDEIMRTRDYVTGEALDPKDWVPIKTDKAIRNLADAMMSAEGDTGTRMHMFRNGMEGMIADAGAKEGVSLDKVAVNKIINDASTGFAFDLEGGTKGEYGINRAGESISRASDPLVEDKTSSQAIWDNQRGYVNLPDPTKLRRAVKEADGFLKAYQGFDEWMAGHVTQPFKRLAMLNPATGERIAMAESLPELFRSPKEYFKSIGMNSTVKDAYRHMFDGLTNEEAADIGSEAMEQLLHHENLIGTMKSGELGNAAKVIAEKDPEAVLVHTYLAAKNRGRFANAVLGAQDIPAGEVGMTKEESGLAALLKQQGPSVLREHGITTYGREEGQQHIDAWFKQILGLKNEQSAKVGSASFLESFGSSAVHDEAWFEAAHEKAVNAVLEDLKTQDPARLSQLKRTVGVKEDGVLGFDPSRLRELAEKRVEALEGLTFAPVDAGPIPHLHALESIATGRPIARKALTDVAENLRPINVIGRDMMHMPNGTLLERISNAGWKHVFDPMISTLSRDPMFATRMRKEYSVFSKAVEEGTVSLDDAMRISEQRATAAMIPFIHNPAERSMFADAVRNFIPFYYAQEQAYKRLGRLAFDDPGAFRRMQLTAHAMENAGTIQTDETGQKHLVYPGLGFLMTGTDHLLNRLGIPLAGSVPLAVSGQVQSLESVVPLAEGLSMKYGPLVSMPLNALETLMPESQPLVHGVIGDQAASAGVWEQIMPNSTVRNLYKAFAGDHSRTFQSSMMYTIQAMKYHDDTNPKVKAWNDAYQKFLNGEGEDPGVDKFPGFVPPATAGPVEQQKFIDRVKNQTRLNFTMKALLGSILPAAPTLEVGDAKLRSEYQDLIKKKGISEASLDFIKHHPDATAYTVFQSKTTSGGYLPAVEQAQQWLDNHSALIKKYPYAAAWLIPQPEDANAFSSAAYNEQMAQHLRRQKTPEEFYKNLYVAAGNAQFYDHDKKDFDAEYEQLKAAGDKSGAAAARSAFANYILQFGQQNPLWWDEFNSEDRKHRREMSIAGLNQIFQKGLAPKNKQSRDVKGLLQDYEEYRLNLLSAGQQYGSASTDDEKAAWSDYMDELKAKKPHLSAVIDQLFRAGA